MYDFFSENTLSSMLACAALAYAGSYAYKQWSNSRDPFFKSQDIHLKEEYHRYKELISQQAESIRQMKQALKDCRKDYQVQNSLLKTFGNFLLSCACITNKMIPPCEEEPKHSGFQEIAVMFYSYPELKEGQVTLKEIQDCMSLRQKHHQDVSLAVEAFVSKEREIQRCRTAYMDKAMVR